MSTKAILIGREVEVIGSSNPSCIGIRGTVIDETANTLVVDVGGASKRLIKQDVVLDVHGVRIDGVSLIGRPETRIKKREKKQWR
ncbi:MAG: ribonuclease P protein subunit [Candidatus Methanofastidiosa archaeon]|jgi:RNase P/RNase MRP subunit p29|nr:ribonuclease P protein subunit [Candidatus Methanofastidiosa archaeon]